MLYFKPLILKMMLLCAGALSTLLTPVYAGFKQDCADQLLVNATLEASLDNPSPIIRPETVPLIDAVVNANRPTAVMSGGMLVFDLPSKNEYERVLVEPGPGMPSYLMVRDITEVDDESDTNPEQLRLWEIGTF